MIQGNANSKLREALQKEREKNISPNVVQRSKTLPEKTKFTSQLNSDKVPKTGEKKILKSVAQNELRVKTDARTYSTRVGKENDGRNVRRYACPVQAKSHGPQKIEAGSSSVPAIATIPTMAKSSSVTYNKIADTKIPRYIPIKTTALKKMSNDSKNGVLMRKLELKQAETSSNIYSTQIGIKLGKVTGLKKSTTCPPCVKLKEVEKETVNCQDLKRNRPKSCGEVSMPGDKTRCLSRDVSQGKIVKENSTRKMGELSRSTEVKRMKSESNSGFSLSIRLSARNTPLKPRQATSEIKDLNMKKKYENSIYDKIGVDGAIIAGKTKEKVENGAFNNHLENHVAHVHNAEIAVTGTELKDDSKKNDSRADKLQGQEPCSRDLDVSELSHSHPTERYDSLNSMEEGIHSDEVLSLDKRIWNDLEEEIGETWEKEGCLYERGDDSGDSFCDMIRQLHLPQDGEERKPGKAETKLKQRKTHSPDSKAKEISPEKEEAVNEGLRPRKGAKQTLGEKREPKRRKIIPNARKGKSREDNQRQKSMDEEVRECRKWLREHEENTAGEGKSIKLTGPGEAPSEFFKTHKNIGFIGRVEDEECVSFDPAQVTLYQPRESQMLIHDLANCVATQAYLKMCGINYKLAERKNAEHMSPSGKVPFVSSCLCIIPEFEGIVSFMQYKKYSCIRIEECDKTAFRATISMIVDTLESAERYMCWCDDDTLIKYTKPKVAGLFPFPLNHIIYWKKRYEERKRLADEEMKKKSFDTIIRGISTCFRTLSQLLGSNSFFFGNACTEIDALVYGHIYAAFTTEQEGLFRDLQFIIKQFPNLISFAVNFDKTFLLEKFSSINLPRWGEFRVMTAV